MTARVKKGDIIQVISGKEANKGKIGKVLKVLRKNEKVIIDGINIVKKATRPDPANNKQGGIVAEPAPLNISKVMPYCNSCHRGVKVRYERANGKVIRKCAKCGAVLEYK
jgi:large subunit ribosomal protein L24